MSSIIVEKSPIWPDVRDIVNDTVKPITFEYRGLLHTVKDDVPVMKIISVDTIRDYVNNIGDHIQISFKMPLGEYATRLYPFRTNLEFTIKKIREIKEGESSDKVPKVSVQRYKAVFITEKNRTITATEVERIDTASLNAMDIVDVKLQLLPRSLEPLRIKTVSGIFRKVTMKQLIHNLLGGESMKVLVDGKPSITGIDIVEPDNKEVKNHVIFPNGSRIINIPTYLQEKMGGVYSAGIGTYLQQYNDELCWYVYPLFNTTRFKTSKDNRLIVYGIPGDKFAGTDRTYRIDGNILHVIATGATKYRDSADVDYMNKGSGFRMMDARTLMKKPVEVTEDGPKGRRTNVNFEVAAEDREDGLNFAPTLTGGVSTNPFKEYSKINGRNVAQFDFVWEHGNVELLYPGMPCKYIYLDGNKIVELMGTVSFIHSLTALQGNGISSKVYKSVCTVTLLIQQKEPTRELPKQTEIGKF